MVDAVNVNVPLYHVADPVWYQRWSKRNGCYKHIHRIALMARALCMDGLQPHRCLRLASVLVCEAHLIWMALAPLYLEGSADPVPKKLTCTCITCQPVNTSGA